MTYPTKSNDPRLNSIDLWKKIERALEEKTQDEFHMSVGHDPREPMKAAYDVEVDCLSAPPNGGADNSHPSGYMDADAALQMGVPTYLTKFDAFFLPGNDRPNRMYLFEIATETDYAGRFEPEDAESLRQGKVLLGEVPEGFELGLKTAAYVPNDTRIGISDSD